MNEAIEVLRSSGTTVQALGVSAGGLIGVFATLATFFVIILVAVRFGGNEKA